MKVDFAFLCDHAEISGKINALGIGFDTIYAREVPARHPYFYLVAQIRASIAEAGDKELTVRLIDEDGKDLTPEIRTAMSIGSPRQGKLESLGRISIGFNNVKFPRYANCSVHAVIDGHEMIRIPLSIEPPDGQRVANA